MHGVGDGHTTVLLCIFCGVGMISIVVILLCVKAILNDTSI